MSMQPKPSKETGPFIKALSQHTDADHRYKMFGFELAYLLDPRQHKNFVLVWKGYKEGMGYK